jgi:hypothetical protein
MDLSSPDDQLLMSKSGGKYHFNYGSQIEPRPECFYVNFVELVGYKIRKLQKTQESDD